MLYSIKTVSAIATICILGGIARPQVPSNPDINPKEANKFAVIGEEAPQFSLKDQFGKNHKLSSYKDKIVVLEWFNEACPFCKGAWEKDVIPNLIESLKGGETEVVYLTINSTANQSKEEILKGGSEFLEEFELDIPMLMDYDGKVGKMYGAKTTPHMFVIDANGILAYHGALSNDARFKRGDEATVYVMEAVEQLEAGKDVSPEYVKPWGCSVKYARDKKRGLPPAGRRTPRPF